MSVAFVFLDGVGVGPDDPTTNPFAGVPTPTWDALVGGRHGTFTTLDATLGVAGRPQSATGQATLLSGRDAVAAMDGHYGPWPGPTLKRFLAAGEWLGETAARHGPDAVAWGSAYPRGFFDALARGRLRPNVPVHAAREAGVTLPDLDAYARGDAVAADLDGAAFAAMGVDPPGGAPPGPAAAEAAGRRLARRAATAALTFLDVWTSDAAGHAADLAAGRAYVARLDAFLAGLLGARDASTTVVITSDHGNLEDLGHGRHTRAPVPLAAVGPHADAFAGATSLLDVAPAVRRALDGTPG